MSVSDTNMSEEDINLSVCMHKLKIIPRQKAIKRFHDENLPLPMNPFARRNRTKSVSYISLFGASCSCRKKRVCRNTTSFKKNNTKNKLLREPIIVLLDKCSHKCVVSDNTTNSNDILSASSSVANKDSGLFGDNMSGNQDFRSIIDGCKQLSLSNESNDPLVFSSQSFRDVQNRAVPRLESRELSSSCSQQAMARLCLNPPCDVTIDELACYFETFVHIPKKMSSMAEMMYI